MPSCDLIARPGLRVGMERHASGVDLRRDRNHCLVGSACSRKGYLLSASLVWSVLLLTVGNFLTAWGDYPVSQQSHHPVERIRG